MVEQDKMSTKQKRERAEQNLKNSKEAIAMIDERLDLMKKIHQRVRDGWKVTDKYKENAIFEYETDPEYLKLQLEQKELEWEEKIIQLEQTKSQHEMNATAARKAIKANRG